MKTSFVSTVLNEQATIKVLLDSLSSQTKKPDEIIIIDAGSTDKTTQLIKTHPLKPKLIIKPGFNRSQARNLAIKTAKNQIIAVSDAGCVLDKNWLKLITQPFIDKSVDAVAGFYQPITKTVFQKSIAPFVAVMPDRLDTKTYLPPSRSIAFSKTAWQKADKYPENLNYCEDLLFAHKLKQKTKMTVEPKALVYWQQANNLPQFFYQIKHYAQGDVQARYRPHLTKISTVFLRYLIFIVAPWLFLIYLLWSIFKHYRYVQHPLALIYLPTLQLTADLAVMVGSFQAMV